MGLFDITELPSNRKPTACLVFLIMSCIKNHSGFSSSGLDYFWTFHAFSTSLWKCHDWPSETKGLNVKTIEYQNRLKGCPKVNIYRETEEKCLCTYTLNNRLQRVFVHICAQKKQQCLVEVIFLNVQSDAIWTCMSHSLLTCIFRNGKDFKGGRIDSIQLFQSTDYVHLKS